MAAAKGTIRELLENTKASELSSPKGRVVVISSARTPSEAFQLLVSERILSAPVHEAGSKNVIGILDLRDLIAYVVFGEKEKKHANVNELVNLGIKMHTDARDGVTVSYLARRNPFEPVKHDATLFQVSQVLAKGKHRVPVINEKNEIINIISQSSIINFLVANKSKLTSSSMQKTLAELKIGSSPVASVSARDPAFKAFQELDRTKFSGIAVVDASGKLLTSTSGKDLKLWLRNPSSELLQDNIIHFLQKIRETEIDITTPVLSISDTETLGKAVQKLQATHSHRIFVTDKNFRPLRCVSLTDIIRQVILA